MLNAYIQVTGNVSILTRALPIAETELQWWRTNRTISVTSPYTGTSYSVARYFVTNSAPRPEGYVEDITTAFGGNPALNESARSALYAELASGAETGERVQYALFGVFLLTRGVAQAGTIPPVGANNHCSTLQTTTLRCEH